MSRLSTEVGQAATDQFVARVVPALTQAYTYNGKRHSPENGDDDLSFGVLIWRNSAYLLGEQCADLPDSEITERGLSFEVELAGRTFRFYKMPPRLGDNVEAFTMAGSKVKAAQAQINDDQLALFEAEWAALAVEDSVAGSRFSRLVVLHQGNPLDGLRWIVVGAPSATHGWHWHEKIFDASWASATKNESTTEVSSVTEKPLDIRLKANVVPKSVRNKA